MGDSPSYQHSEHMAHSLSGRLPAIEQDTHNCILCSANVGPHFVRGSSISSLFVPAECVKESLLGWINHHPERTACA